MGPFRSRPAGYIVSIPTSEIRRIRRQENASVLVGGYVGGVSQAPCQVVRTRHRIVGQ